MKRCVIGIITLSIFVLTAIVIQSECAYADQSQADLLVQFMMEQKDQKTRDENGNPVQCAGVIAAAARVAGMKSDQMKLQDVRYAMPFVGDNNGNFNFITSDGTLRYNCLAWTWKDFLDGTYQPKKGDLFFLGSVSTANMTIPQIAKTSHTKYHVGVLRDNNSTITKLRTIEGNVSGGYTKAYNQSMEDSQKGIIYTIKNKPYYVTVFIRPNYDYVATSPSDDLDQVCSVSDNTNGHIYYLFEKSMSWTTARSFAQSLGEGYDLATIDGSSNNEQSIIEELVDNYGYACWLGAIDLDSGWEWVTGISISTNDTRWASGQPSGTYNSSNEHYLGIYANSTQTSYAEKNKWNDFSINSGTIKGFVVEYDPPQLSPSVGAMTYTVIYDGVLLKSGPGNSYTTLRTMSIGDQFSAEKGTEVSNDGLWAHVEVSDGIQGWINISNEHYCLSFEARYASPIDEYQVVTTEGGGLWINKKYNKSGCGIKVMPKGSHFYVLRNTAVQSGNYTWAYGYYYDSNDFYYSGWIAISNNAYCIKITDQDWGEWIDYCAEPSMIDEDTAKLGTWITASCMDTNCGFITWESSDNSVLEVYPWDDGDQTFCSIIAVGEGTASITVAGKYIRSFTVVSSEDPLTAPDFVVPSSLKTIESEAFYGISAKRIQLSDNVISIGSKAFANCPNLVQIYIPAECDDIATDAFNGLSNVLTIFGIPGSYAETYATLYGYGFVSVN